MGDQTPAQLIPGPFSRPISPRPLSANSHRSSNDEKEKKGLMLPPPVPVKTNKGQEDKPAPYVTPHILLLHLRRRLHVLYTRFRTHLYPISR